MKILASLQSNPQRNIATVQTNDILKNIDLPGKDNGAGSSINGGELLFLAIATCYCNDIYREAVKKNIAIDSIEVEVSGDFGNEGEPGSNISYKVKIRSSDPEETILNLINETDKIAEIHNTLRKGASVTLSKFTVN